MKPDERMDLLVRAGHGEPVTTAEQRELVRHERIAVRAAPIFRDTLAAVEGARKAVVRLQADLERNGPSAAWLSQFFPDGAYYLGKDLDALLWQLDYLRDVIANSTPPARFGR